MLQRIQQFLDSLKKTNNSSGISPVIIEKEMASLEQSKVVCGEISNIYQNLFNGLEGGTLKEIVHPQPEIDITGLECANIRYLVNSGGFQDTRLEDFNAALNNSDVIQRLEPHYRSAMIKELQTVTSDTQDPDHQIADAIGELMSEKKYQVS